LGICPDIDKGFQAQRPKQPPRFLYEGYFVGLSSLYGLPQLIAGSVLTERDLQKQDIGRVEKLEKVGLIGYNEMKYTEFVCRASGW